MPDRYALWSLLGVALLASVITDLKSRRIPDLITYPTAALALGYRFWRGGLGDLEHGVISGLVSGLSAAALFSLWAVRNKVGWGDVKLLLAVGCVFGYPLVMAALVFVSLCGLLQGVVTLMWKGELAKTLGGMLRLKRKPGAEPVYIPFGVAIALGCVWTMWWDRNT